MLHLRAKPGNWQSFERVTAFYFYYLCNKKYSVIMTPGPSAHGQLERDDRFFFEKEPLNPL